MIHSLLDKQRNCMGYFSIKDLATTNKVLTQPKPLEKLKFGCTGEKVNLKNGSDETIHFSIFLTRNFYVGC